jgi:predicted RNA-binding Zn ribbon-like protein
MMDALHDAPPGIDEHPSLALVDSAGLLPGGKEFDELATPASTMSWLRSRDLIAGDAELYDYCRNRLAGLRSVVRELVVARIGGVEPSAGAVRALNDALTSAPSVLRLRFDTASGFSRTAEHPATQVVEHAMALIAEDAASLLTGEDAAKLALCGADSCDRVFLRTHARRQWCSTRCGDRMRAARAYARKRSGAA